MRNLGRFRLAWCALLAVTVALTGPGYDSLYAARICNPIPLFEILHIPNFGPSMFQGLRLALVLSLTLSAFGLFTRPALAASTALYFLYFGTQLGLTKASGTNYVYHSENLAFFVLLVLCACPAVSLCGIDGMRRRAGRWSPEAAEARGSAWALPLLALLLGLAYFGSAWCKLTASPLWADGDTLQGYLAVKYLLNDTDLGFRLARSWSLCLVLGIATLILEAGFWTAVFFPRRAWIYAVSGLAFHVGIYLTMHINFLLYHCYTYVLFVFWPGRREGESTPVALVSRRERVFAYGLIATFLVCVIGRVESWPFSDFRVYEQRTSFQKVRVYRVAGIDSAGNRTWIPREDLPRSETTLNAELSRLFGRRDMDGAAKFLAEIASSIPAPGLSRYRSVAVFRRSIEVSPGGEIEPADLLMIQTPVIPPTR